MINNDILRQLSEVADSSMATEPNNDDLLEIKRLVNQLQFNQETCPYCHNSKGMRIFSADDRAQSAGEVDVCDEQLCQYETGQHVIQVLMDPRGYLLYGILDEWHGPKFSFIETDYHDIKLDECPMCHRKLRTS